MLAHSEKEKAAPTWKKTYGFHPLAAFADHGAGAGGEALAILLRAGNAGPDTAAEHIEVTRLALAQLPGKLRRRVLIRTDSGGGTHEFLAWLASPSRRLRYPVGMTITEDMQQAILTLPERVWEPAYDTGRRGTARGVGSRADRPAGPIGLARGNAEHYGRARRGDRYPQPGTFLITSHGGVRARHHRPAPRPRLSLRCRARLGHYLGCLMAADVTAMALGRAVRSAGMGPARGLEYPP